MVLGSLSLAPLPASADGSGVPDWSDAFLRYRGLEARARSGHLVVDRDLSTIAAALVDRLVLAPRDQREGIRRHVAEFVRERGIPDQPLVSFTMNAASLQEGLSFASGDLDRIFSDGRLDRVGLAREPDPEVRGTDLYVVLASARRVRLVGSLDAILPGESVTIALEAMTDLDALELLVTQPSGAVVDVPLEGARPIWGAEIAFPDAGTYDIEVMGSLEFGPEVLALARVRVGGTPSAPRDAGRNADATRDRTEIARVLHALLNDARQDAGVGIVRWDTDLAECSRRYADTMQRLDHLAHIDRAGRDVRDRWAACGGGDLVMGENLARGSSARSVHEQFLASPAHRRNMLHEDWTDVGIGVHVDRAGDVWTAMTFVSRPLVLGEVRWTSLAVRLRGTLERGRFLGVLADGELASWIDAGPEGEFDAWVEYPAGYPSRIELVLVEAGSDPRADQSVRYRKVTEIRPFP